MSCGCFFLSCIKKPQLFIEDCIAPLIISACQMSNLVFLSNNWQFIILMRLFVCLSLNVDGVRGTVNLFQL